MILHSKSLCSPYEARKPNDHLFFQNTVVEEYQKEMFLKILSDKYSRALIHFTQYRPISAIEIHKKSGIPIGTIHRRLRNLEKCKILKISGTINEKGKKVWLFQSRIKNIRIFFESPELNVDLISNEKMKSFI